MAVRGGTQERVKMMNVTGRLPDTSSSFSISRNNEAP